MKLIKVTFFILGFCVPHFLPAQTNIDYMRFGDYAFEAENFASAAYYYSKILGENPEGNLPVFPYDPIKCGFAPNPAKDSMMLALGLKQPNLHPDKPEELDINRYHFIIYRLAESYRLSYNYENAEKWYEKALSLELFQFPYLRFWYGMTLKSNGKYTEAIDQFVQFVNEYHEPDSYYTLKAQREIAGCDYAIQKMKYPRRDEVSIISHGSTFYGSNQGASINPEDSNSVIYASSKQYNFNEKSTNETKKSDFNIYQTSSTELGWNIPIPVSELINSDYHDYAPCISIDGKNLYFTRTINNPKNPETAIYLSKKINGKWLAPEKLNENLNMPGFKSMHPSLSLDMRYLFFASDRPGGLGKMDIWISILDDNGNPLPPENLGERINTSENEVTPYYHYESQSIFFSSDGRVGFGGYDIFKALQGDGTWSNPENLGFPINSGKDDMYYVVSSMETFGYLSSDRDGGCECLSGYCYNIYTVKPRPLVIALSGYVYNDKTKKPLTNVLIVVEDNLGNNQAILSDDVGFYSMELSENVSYYLKTKKVTYFSASAVVNTEGIYESADLKQDFYLERIPIGEIEIPGILYDYDKWDLRIESKQILDEVANFLDLNDNIVIEIASHTDDRGNNDYNYILSQKRAKSVVEYLVEKGIDTARLTSIGFGENKLLVEKAETEDDHQKNRRTTFRILSEDYVPKI